MSLYGWKTSGGSLGKPLRGSYPPLGDFAPWFDEKGDLPVRVRDRFDIFRKEFKLDDVAVVPPVEWQSPEERRLRPAGYVGLLGSSRNLLALVRSYRKYHWWRVLAAVSGETVPYSFVASGGRSPCEGCGQWQHISGPESGIVDWVELDDFLPSAFNRGAEVERGQARFRSDAFVPQDHDFRVIPRPGGPVAPWYSVKTGRWMEAVESPVWDMCQVFGSGIYGSVDGPIRLWLDAHVPVVITHIAKAKDVEAMVACGGLLWPSFAVSWQPHTWTGDVRFVLDVSVLERNLSPTASRGTRDKTFYLANTDTWTPTVRDLEATREKAEAELRGGKEMQGSYLHVLGPDVSQGEGMVSGSRYIKTWAALKSRVKTLRRLHGDDYRELSHEELARSGDWEANRYPYLELKIADRMDVNSCPLVVVERAALKVVGKALGQLNYRGSLEAYDPVEPVDQQRAFEVQHALAARQVMEKWISKKPSREVRTLRSGMALRGLDETDALRRLGG